MLAGVAAASVASPAFAQAAKSFDIPPQSLAGALEVFGKQSGAEILYDRGQVEGLKSPGVKAVLRPVDALGRLVAGSGLTIHQPNASTFVVSSPSKSAGAPAGSDVITQVAELVVTSRKREEQLDEVPAAITVFSGRALSDAGAREMGDFLQQSPGVSFVGDGGFSLISIRGVATSLGGNTNGYYLDSVPFTGVNTPWYPNVQPFDLDRVEVLRGPQGTLFGEGSMGGTVRILTKAPDLDDYQGRVEAFTSSTVGGDAGHGARAMFNAPLIKDVAALRIVGINEDRGGWTDSAGAHNYNDEKLDTWRARLRITPTSRLTLDLSAWTYDQHLKGKATAFDTGRSAGPQPLDQGYDQYAISADYKFDWGDLRYAYGDNRLNYSLNAPYLNIGTLDATIDVEVETHELMATGEAGGRLTWTAGYYRRSADRRDHTGLTGGPIKLDDNSTTTSVSDAIFAELEYRVSDHWRVALGGRQYWEDLKVYSKGVGATGPIDAGFGADYSSFNPRLVVTYEPRAGRLFYLSAAKGFRGGQAQPVSSVQLARLVGLKLPETLPADTIWTYEAGLKAKMFDGRLYLEAAAYHSDWSNPTVRAEIVPGFNGLTTAKALTIDGAELSGVFKLTDRLVANGGVSYVDSAFTEAVPGSAAHAGDPPEYVSPLSWNLALTYQGPGIGAYRSIGRVGAQFTSAKENHNAAANRPGDDVLLVDARIGLQSDRLGAYLFGSNLTDDGGALSARESLGAARARPATIGVELSANF